MLRSSFLLFICLLVSHPVFADESEVGVPTPPTAAANSVPGLELPPDQSVPYDEGFVNIQAKCKSEVKWLVISDQKIKYLAYPTSIIISVPPKVPPEGGQIHVFAIAYVDAKLTEFVKTTVTVKSPTPNPPTPNPVPPPSPTPNPVPPLHFTFLIDFNNTTPELGALLNSETLRKSINQKGNWFRLYDIKSTIVTQKKLDTVVSKVGSSAVLVIQDNNGAVVNALPIPKTEQEILNLVK